MTKVRVSNLKERKRLFVNLNTVPRDLVYKGNAINFIISFQKAIKKNNLKDLLICKSRKDILTIVANKLVYEFEDTSIKELEELRDNLTQAIDLIKEKQK